MEEAHKLLMPFHQTLLAELTRAVGPSNAADITQEVYSRAMQFCMNKGLPYSPLPWLRTIARNVRRNRSNQTRSRERHVPWDELQRLAEQTQGLLSNQAVHGFDLDDLEVAINALKPHMQVLVREHYFGGKTYGELSAELGIGPGVVKCRVFRIRRRIERQLRGMRWRER